MKPILQHCFLQKIQIDPTEIYRLIVNKTTEELKSLHYLDEKTAKKLICAEAKTPPFTMTPKIHKDGKPRTANSNFS